MREQQLQAGMAVEHAFENHARHRQRGLERPLHEHLHSVERESGRGFGRDRMHEQQQAELLGDAEQGIELGAVERPSARGGGQQRGSRTVEIDSALEFVGAAVGFRQRERRHQFEPPLPFRRNARAVFVQRAGILDARCTAGPCHITGWRTDELQIDIAARETGNPLGHVGQVFIQRMRRRVAAPDPEPSVRASFGGETECRFAAERFEKSEIQRVGVGVNDQLRHSLVGREPAKFNPTLHWARGAGPASPRRAAAGSKHSCRAPHAAEPRYDTQHRGTQLALPIG